MAHRHSAAGFRGTNQVPRLNGETPARASKAAWPANSDGDNPEDEIVTEQLFLRASVLWLLTVCCYGAQVLL
ncbi:MAG: hypothetical protein ACLP6E_11140, partial [Acidimicrobiales bacterium]